MSFARSTRPLPDRAQQPQIEPGSADSRPKSVRLDLGAIERIGPDEILQALRMPSVGRVFDLGAELNESIPHGEVGFLLFWRDTPEGTAARGGQQYALEVVQGPLHISSHIDGLAHIQVADRIYGGALAAEARTDRGWLVNGIHSVPPIVGRCVILDVASALGQDVLPDTYAVTPMDLEKTCALQQVEITHGDIVLVRTGKMGLFYKSEPSYLARQPGLRVDAAVWLYDRGMAALGTDTAGTEPVPVVETDYTLHDAMIMERGVLLMENLDLEEVVAEKVRSGLFVCLPLKITGATGSWIRPIIIV